MADTAVINSGADLAATAPADIFSGIEDTGTTDTGTIEAPESLEDFSADTEDPAEPETETAEPETETAEPEPLAAKPETETEELPEGVVRGKNRQGKEGLFVEDNRWKTIYGNHQLVQKVSEILGEPATQEALQLRNDAYMAQERLFSDLNSGDPKAQAEVLGYVLDEMTRAREQGEVGVDPAVPFAQTMYSTLREKSPQAYAGLRFSAARDLVGEMFSEAAATGNESLFLSAQHFAKAIASVPKDLTDIAQVRTIVQRMGIPFFSKAEMPSLVRNGTVDPVSHLQAENLRLTSLLNGNGNQQAAQLDTWFNGVSQNVKTGILDEAIKPALASVEGAWKEFPNDYQDLVVDRLQRKVTETMKADQGFSDRIKLLDSQARRAASAQRRDEIGKVIRQAYVNRAKLAVEAVKRPILDFAANRLKERADQTHVRRQAAQNRTVPKGTAGTVPRSLTPDTLIPMKNNVFDPATAMKQAAQLLGG